MNRIKTEVKEVSVLLRSIPSLTMTLFIVSVITMNLLANKSIIRATLSKRKSSLTTAFFHIFKIFSTYFILLPVL